MKPSFVWALYFALVAAAQVPNGEPWKPLEFLIGDWIGEGSGGPGQGAGEFSFHFDLQKNVLIRKNFAEYPAQAGRPASRHDDLMIVYLDEQTKRPRAVYFDSEGHVIRYTVTPAGSGLVFESEAGEPGMHYRLTYTPAGERIKGKFEMRAPGEAQYKSYLDFAVRRK